MPSPPRFEAYSYPDDVSRLASSLMSLHERKLERERMARAEERQARLDQLAQEEMQRKARLQEDMYQIELGKLQQQVAGETPLIPGGKVSIAPNKITLEEPPLPPELQPTGGMSPEELAVHEATGEPALPKTEIPTPGFEGQAPDFLPLGRTYKARLSGGQEIPFPLQYKQEAEAEERRKMLMHPTIQAAMIRAASTKDKPVDPFASIVEGVAGGYLTLDEKGQPVFHRTAAERAEPTTRYSPRMVMVDGKEVMANYDAMTATYHDPDTGEVLKGVQPPPTTETRNKALGRDLVSKSINAIKPLSEDILTKIGPAQRATAIKRGASAVWGTDPTFRTYQDARYALAGNLAVAQQGSRPSDADIKAIWLPLIPDPFSDTEESMRMKWDIIEKMAGVDLGGAAPAEGGQASPLRVQRNKRTGETRYSTDGGKTWLPGLPQ